MAGHVIVCGLGQVGYRVVDLLRRLGESVTVVALPPREDWLQDVRARGVEVLIGDARDSSRLRDAGLRDAAALVAATDQDLVNIEIALEARQVRPDLPVVLRLFDQTLAQQLEASFDLRRAVSMSALAAPAFAAAALGEQVLGAFDVDGQPCVIGRLAIDAASPLAHQSAQQAGAAHGVAVLSHTRPAAPPALLPPPDTPIEPGDTVTLLSPTARWAPMVAGPRAAGGQLAARPGAGRRLVAAALDFVRQVWANTSSGLRAVFFVLNLLIALSVVLFHLAMGLEWEDALYFVITTVTTVGYGDISVRDAPLALKLYTCLLMVLGSATIATLYSIITDFIVTSRFRQLFGQQRLPQADHVVVVGLSNVGFRIVHELRAAGMRPVGVQVGAPDELGDAIRSHTPIVVGDARLGDTLAKVGAARARAVIAATDDDAMNLGVGLAAKRLNPSLRTVIRLFDANLAQKVQAALAVDVAMSATQIAAPTFVAAALYPDVRHALLLGDCLVVIRHRTVAADWAGYPPSWLRAEHGTTILMRWPAGARSIAPDHGDTPLSVGECVLAAIPRPLVS